IVLVTSGSGGIGDVKLSCERGLKAVVLDVILMNFEAPSNVHYYRYDITIAVTIASVAFQIHKDVGTPTLLINNAGVARGMDILDVSEKGIRFTFEVNTLSSYWMSKEILPAMVKASHSIIVTVSSLAAHITVLEMTDHAASKATELKTRDTAPEVRMFIFNQGYIKTPLFKGYKNDSRFLVPTLEQKQWPKLLSRTYWAGVVESSYHQTLRYQLSFGANSESIKTKWHGRKVITLSKNKQLGTSVT
ncbi:NAD(P)-binding protein, partial [Diplocarpon rosae]